MRHAICQCNKIKHSALETSKTVQFGGVNTAGRMATRGHADGDGDGDGDGTPTEQKLLKMYIGRICSYWLGHYLERFLKFSHLFHLTGSGRFHPIFVIVCTWF